MWSVVMFGIVFYIFSLIFVQQVATLLKESGDPSDPEIAAIVSAFPRVDKAMLTLTMAAFFYLVFIAFTQIALINIITGIFVDSAMENLSPDKELLAHNLHAEEREHEKELTRLCIDVNDDHS